MAGLLRFVSMKPSSLPLSLLAFGLLPACHVFDGGEIDVTCDEIPSCLDVSDDTSASATGSFGFAVASGLEDYSQYSLQYYQDGELVHDLEGTASGVEENGGFGEALEYVSDPPSFYFSLTSTDIIQVTASDFSVEEFTVSTDMRALESDGEQFYAIMGDAIRRVDLANADFETFTVSTDSIDGLFSDADGGVYVLDRQTPSVLALDSEAQSAETLASGFDDGTRVVSAFIGHDDALYSCSSAGAIYRVSDLEAGDLVPLVYSEELEGASVGLCAYDPTTTTYVLATQQAIYSLGLDGSVETLATPPMDEFLMIDFVHTP